MIDYKKIPICVKCGKYIINFDVYAKVNEDELDYLSRRFCACKVPQYPEIIKEIKS